MSKVESILFDADEGPASSLLRQVDGVSNTKSSNSNRNNNHPVTDYPMTAAPQEQQLQAQNQVSSLNHIDTAAVTTRSETASSLVGCNISPSSAMSPQSVLSDDHSVSLSQQLQLQQQSSGATIRKLREQIQTLQNEVIEERTLRKRKEKSILKLAKELTSRSMCEHRSNQKMEELQETILDLEHRLLERNRTIQSTVPQLQIQNEQLNQSIISHQKQIQLLQQQQQMMKSRERSMQKSNQMVLLLQQQSPKQNTLTLATTTVVTDEARPILSSLPLPLVDTSSATSAATTTDSIISSSSSSASSSVVQQRNGEKKNNIKEEMAMQVYSPSLLGELSERSATAIDLTTIDEQRYQGGIHKEIHSTEIQRVVEERGRSTTTTTHTIEDEAIKTLADTTNNNMPHFNVMVVLWLLLIIGILIVIGNDSTWMRLYNIHHHDLLTSTVISENNHIPTKRRIIDIVMDGICAPVRPGTIWTLGKNNKGRNSNADEYVAPWWVPSSLSSNTTDMKEYIFNVVCTSRQRTRIEINHNSISIYGCLNADATGHNRNKKTMKPIWKWKLFGDGNVIAISSNQITIVSSLYQPRKWNPNTNDHKNSMSTTAITVDHVTSPWSSQPPIGKYPIG